MLLALLAKKVNAPGTYLLLILPFLLIIGYLRMTGIIGEEYVAALALLAIFAPLGMLALRVKRYRDRCE